LADVTAAEWDQSLSVYADATVFHLASWHKCLDRLLPGRVVRFEILSHGEVCGHWCGFLLQKFGVRIFGAPLPGSTTDYMYPLMTQPLPVGPFLHAVHNWAEERRVHMIELGGEYFRDQLAANGYNIRSDPTYRVDLSAGSSAVWKNLKPAMRNKIRKAEKNGIVVGVDTSTEFAGRFFDMLQAVFRRQGLAPTYGLRRVETVVRTLAESGNVVPLTAWRDGEPLSSLIVLVDKRAAYFWGGASYETAYPLGANDIIHWYALQFAVGKGLTVYDTCGGGEYKTKFGGQMIALPAGYVATNPVFGALRTAVQGAVRARSVALGRLKRGARLRTRRSAGTAPPPPPAG
jgi:hypothetical protein